MHLILFVTIVVFAYLLTLGIIRLAVYIGLVDRPDGARKLQAKPIPLLGGLGIFIAFLTGLYAVRAVLLSGNLELSHWAGFALGGLILMAGGYLDDRYNLSPRVQIIFPLLAALAPIIGGVSIARLSNPLGGVIDVPMIISALLIVLWLLGMMYTTKLLDGVDGLVSGLGVIGALVIFLFTSTTQYFQPDIAIAAWIFAAACLGFLILNYNPAKIYLGEGGSLFVGYVLGVLAIISGGKIAIALLIMGLPILDVAWTIARRLLSGKNPFRFADRRHLHHRLLDLGLSPRQTVGVFYAFAAVFGLSGLFLQSKGKLLALIVLLSMMLIVVVFFSWWERKRRPSLLLQVCCAPCASYSTLMLLKPAYRVTWYFYNPNLSSQAEYDKRLEAVKRAAKIIDVSVIAVPYEHGAWREMVAGKEDAPEHGERCLLCYRERLQRAYDFAKDKYDFFSTSLLASPYKDGEAIRRMSKDIVTGKTQFLDVDFQVNDGFRKSIAWAKEHDLYLQKYCGCEFSLKK
ncbi:MAG: epoxyqueuosine reductase QueH [bacterium]|nr:epoxyqueuosine reductase QueH [bacterium]